MCLHSFFVVLSLFRLIILTLRTAGLNGLPLSCWYLVILRIFFKSVLLPFGVSDSCGILQRPLWKNVPEK